MLSLILPTQINFIVEEESSRSGVGVEKGRKHKGSRGSFSEIICARALAAHILGSPLDRDKEKEGTSLLPPVQSRGPKNIGRGVEK